MEQTLEKISRTIIPEEETQVLSSPYSEAQRKALAIERKLNLQGLDTVRDLVNVRFAAGNKESEKAVRERLFNYVAKTLVGFFAGKLPDTSIVVSHHQVLSPLVRFFDFQAPLAFAEQVGMGLMSDPGSNYIMVRMGFRSQMRTFEIRDMISRQVVAAKFGWGS